MMHFGPFSIFLMVFWYCNWVLASDTEISNRKSSFTNKIWGLSTLFEQWFKGTKYSVFIGNWCLLAFFPHFSLPWWWNQFLNRKAPSWGDEFKWNHLGTNFFHRSNQYALTIMFGENEKWAFEYFGQCYLMNCLVSSACISN